MKKGEKTDFANEKMQLRRDTSERLELWNIYGEEMQCIGGHLVHKQYICPWCDSASPSEICLKEKVKR